MTRTTTSKDCIFEQIQAERERQDMKWGQGIDDASHFHDWITYITAYLGKAYTYPMYPSNFRKRMIQVAALAVAAVEALDRKDKAAATTACVSPASPEIKLEVERALG